MTRKTRQAETDEVSAAFHAALTQIGAQTTAEALTLWADVPVELRAATAGGWLRKAITMVMSRRRQSRDLARAYYRLARALQTGSTVADPYHPEPTYVTLADLRREFAALAAPHGRLTEQGGEAAIVADGEASPARQPDSTPQSEPGQAPSRSGTAVDDEPVLENAGTGVEDQGDEHQDDEDDEPDWDRILVEELAGLREDEERIERQAEEELRIVLEALGPASLDRRMTVEDADPDDAHRQVGARQASAASRVAMNGARSGLWAHSNRDRRSLGYVRLSRTGTPCGWCAMLISRGPVYKSQQSAMYADGDKYHDNCHCYAMPVWNREQYQSSELTALSRQYEALWPEVTKGHSGQSAVRVWRRFIRKQQRAAAQEARQSTSTAPEA
ncbi:VG15 protein [Streptomyces sp. NPDC001009]